MAKTGTLNFRVDESLKKSADAILKQLGIPMSTAVDMFLNQIVLTGGMPFDIRLPEAPRRVDTHYMTEEELYCKLMASAKDADAGNRQDLKEFIASVSEEIDGKI